MNALSIPFQAGSGREQTIPLQRYLPPVPADMAGSWAQTAFPPGAWLLDPLGASPTLALEAARAGFRVLVASNNPILTLTLEVLAAAPQEADFQSVLAEIAATRRGEDRLENQLRALYLTPCPVCNEMVPVQSFLWRSGEGQPFGRLMRCSRCSAEGEYPISAYDLDHLEPPGNAAMHRARAAERVRLGDEEPREAVEAALKAYLDRPLYILSTLINRLEGLGLPPERRRLMYALLATTCDEGNALWGHPPGRPRPRQVLIPPAFRENNLWQALENAVTLWSGQKISVPLVRYPALPPESGGICLYSGRVKTLFPLQVPLDLAGVFTIIPRPNQAFWTFSALWSGWFWGRDAILPLKGALERRRYDWQWHTAAMQRVFSVLRQHLPPQVPLLAITPEVIPGFLAGTLAAARYSGYELAGFALNPEPELAQIRWQAATTRQPAHPQPDVLCSEAVQEHLSARGEPASYLQAFSAGLLALTRLAEAPQGGSVLTPEPLTPILSAAEKPFRTPGMLRHFETPEGKSVETGWWWLAGSSPDTETPLADRVEMEILQFLQGKPEWTLPELTDALNQRLPGLLTPPADLIRTCLESYASPLPDDPTRWRLNPQDAAATRRSQLHEVEDILTWLGQRLGLQVRGESPILWQTPDGAGVYAFHTTATSIVSRYLYQPAPLAPERCVVVLPGGRASLLAFKLRRDPHLAETAARGWHFLKFRHLRQIHSNPSLTLEMWQEMLDADPPRWEDAIQMKMF